MLNKLLKLRMNKNLLLYFIAAVTATGGLLFGFDTGVINVALPQLRTKFNPSPTREDTFVCDVLSHAPRSTGTANLEWSYCSAFLEKGHTMILCGL